MAQTSRYGRHSHRATEDRRGPFVTSVASAALAASIAMGTGTGMAQAAVAKNPASEQGGTSPNDSAPEQGGTSPNDSAPQQGGTSPSPSPEQGGTAPSPPPEVNAPGPGIVPDPPQEAPYQPYVAPSTYSNSGSGSGGGTYQAPSYDTPYSAVPDQPLTAPKPTAPVRPIAPPPKKIRVGNYVTNIPKGMNMRDVNSINAWSAYGEAKIAQGLISVGVPHDKASRQAAATIIGVMGGGAIGAAALGIPAAVVGGIGGAMVGAGVGAAIGAFTPPAPFVNAGPGALIGAGVGAVAGAAVVGGGAAIVGGAIGGTIGGVGAYTLGAGDPGAHPKEPWKMDEPPAPKPKPLPNPNGNQYELHLPSEKAQKAGLPKVDYVVNHQGDVNLQVGGWKAGWSAGQAQAPYNALGAGGKQQEDNVRQATKQNESQIKQILPGVNITWPQELTPHPPKH